MPVDELNDGNRAFATSTAFSKYNLKCFKKIIIN